MIAKCNDSGSWDDVVPTGVFRRPGKDSGNQRHLPIVQKRVFGRFRAPDQVKITRQAATAREEDLGWNHREPRTREAKS